MITPNKVCATENIDSINLSGFLSQGPMNQLPRCISLDRKDSSNAIWQEIKYLRISCIYSHFS